MNQCNDRIKDLLPIYADNELTPVEKALVDEHIQVCDDCREELQIYLDISEELNLDSIQAPEGFHADLVEKLNAIPKKSVFNLYKRYNKYLNVAAMLVFVLLLSVIGLTQGNKWGQSSEEALMEKSTMSTEATTEEVKEEAKMEMKEDNTTAESRMADMTENQGVQEESAEEIVEETTELEVMEADAVAIEVKEEANDEVALLTEEVTDDINAEVSNPETANEEDSMAMEASDEEFITAKITSDTSVDIQFSEDTNDNKLGESFATESEEASYTADGSLTLTTEDKENHLQTESPKKEPKTNIALYIALVFLSIIVGGSGFYFIRKRILKN